MAQLVPSSPPASTRPSTSLVLPFVHRDLPLDVYAGCRGVRPTDLFGEDFPHLDDDEPAVPIALDVLTTGHQRSVTDEYGRAESPLNFTAWDGDAGEDEVFAQPLWTMAVENNHRGGSPSSIKKELGDGELVELFLCDATRSPLPLWEDEFDFQAPVPLAHDSVDLTELLLQRDNKREGEVPFEDDDDDEDFGQPGSLLRGHENLVNSPFHRSHVREPSMPLEGDGDLPCSPANRGGVPDFLFRVGCPHDRPLDLRDSDDDDNPLVTFATPFGELDDGEAVFLRGNPQGRQLSLDDAARERELVAERVHIFIGAENEVDRDEDEDEDGDDPDGEGRGRRWVKRKIDATLEEIAQARRDGLCPVLKLRRRTVAEEVADGDNDEGVDADGDADGDGDVDGQRRRKKRRRRNEFKFIAPSSKKFDQLHQLLKVVSELLATNETATKRHMLHR
ncbi:hypothetical protein HK101_009647 [Irineochytrium annulatum]|nr:hypothetical protein HK101_009647 [Irineochytrium annulatum]